MIPSILSQQLRQGVEDFLKTTFPVSTPFFHGIVIACFPKMTAFLKARFFPFSFPLYRGMVGMTLFPK
jgi:DEAD/DEAH box helicase domain-containing protein